MWSRSDHSCAWSAWAAPAKLSPVRGTDLEHVHRAEVADDPVDRRVHRQPVEHGRHETVGVLRRPAADRLRVGAEHRPRRGQSVARGQLLQPPPMGRIQVGLPPAELGVPAPPGVGERRQRGRRGQRVDPPPPVVTGAVVGPPVLEPLLGRQVVAEGDLQRRQRFVGLVPIRSVVQPVQLVEQQLHAHEVGDQQVEGEVQHRPLLHQGQPYVEHRPAARVVRAPAQVLADRRHLVRRPVRVLAAQVQHRDLVRREGPTGSAGSPARPPRPAASGDVRSAPARRRTTAAGRRRSGRPRDRPGNRRRRSPVPRCVRAGTRSARRSTGTGSAARSGSATSSSEWTSSRR